MDRPTTITLPVKYDSDGMLDASSLLLALESAVNDRIRITDWYDESRAREDYPHLDDEERRAMIAAIQTGDWDLAIDQNVRKEVLDDAVEAAGLPLDAESAPSP